MKANRYTVEETQKHAKMLKTQNNLPLMARLRVKDCSNVYTKLAFSLLYYRLLCSVYWLGDEGKRCHGPNHVQIIREF